MYQPRAGGVTTFDIARAAEVSRVTVSRVLNNHHNVTDVLRRRVLRAAADLGYISQRSTTAVIGRGDGAAAPAVRVLRNVGFLFASIRANEPVTVNPFWGPVLHGVEQEATAAGIAVTYRSIDQRSVTNEALAAIVSTHRMDGLLLVGPAAVSTVRAVTAVGRPVVLVDNYVSGERVDAVLSDNFAGGRAAVQHLIEHGHRRVAFIGGPFVVSRAPASQRTNTVWSIEQRALGYWTALREAGIQPDPRLFDGDNLGTAGGFRACQRLLATGRPFSAIFCANDESAVGAMQALHQAGLAVPRDVSVIGFDDIEIAQHLIPPLTTLDVDKEAIGALAMQRLVARALAPNAPSSTVLVHVRLVDRGTVARPKDT